MNLKKLLLYSFLLLAALPVCAQEEAALQPLTEKSEMQLFEDTLAVLGYAVVNDSLPDNRFLACREMIVRLKQALKTPGSFDYPFERLKSISIQYPQDSSFRIFSWQLYVDKEEYRYFGAIQLNTPELNLIPLQDRSFQISEDPEKAVLKPEEWYGAVYYNVKQVDTPQGPYYLLFGFDGYSFYYKRKVIDVLRIQNGQATFGAPVFYHPATQDSPEFAKARIVREYSAAATVKVNYDPTYEIIMFDHLVPGGGQYGEGITYYPDGSYEGYNLQNGRWLYIEKVFDQMSAEAPRDYPILDQREKNIFGKKGKNR
ncbi:hypothetical protein [Flavilitoribacter nigricans]|uniref:Uncharacterized protein n=1 Tax=Flavilitoribacter nigricans (strain ATCC 23147 / DSM 23189 / NBRC 102662 / NCIMB 1420 / SS-2) TaxID=1122177 RepID=A0A2D0NFH7_FLAN2|nr:hypothetical protein [Flavilitoribacter nigricans]PHN07126.1 hypothetical protein CRP01_07815 [Flavilitoribacter nigricans DSM 23189 = NBRC 102662]